MNKIIEVGHNKPYDRNSRPTFVREFYSVHNKKPLEVSFLSYNVVKQLKDGVFESDKWNFDNIK